MCTCDRYMHVCTCTWGLSRDMKHTHTYMCQSLGVQGFPLVSPDVAPHTLLQGLKAQRGGGGLKTAESPRNPRGVGTNFLTGVSIALSFSIAVQVLGQPKPPLPHHTVNSEKSCLWLLWPLPHPLAGLSWPLSSCLGA